MRTRLAATLATLFCFALTATAQEQRGSIQGTLTDASGGILPGATVEARGAHLGAVASTTSDGRVSTASRRCPRAATRSRRP